MGFTGKSDKSSGSAVKRLMYARHGRELMGLKSPVSVSCNVVKRNKIISRWQVSVDSEAVTVGWGLKEA